MYLKRVFSNGNIWAKAESPSRCEMMEFLDKLPSHLRIKIERDLYRLSAGDRVAAEKIKHVEKSIFELRNDAARILFFHEGDHWIVLCCGFIKKSRKLPIQERERALRVLIEYHRAKLNKNILLLEYY